MSNDPRDNRVYTDDDGRRWLTDENGKLLRDESGNHIPPTNSTINSKPGEFTTYDSSQGHCSLCGRLTCRGACFK